MATSEQQSLELLEKVLFKLALTDDSQLEPVLTSVLVPIIRELNTTSDKVRNKIIIKKQSDFLKIIITHAISKTLEVLSHINKRIKTQPNIKLPLRDLRDLFVNPSLNAFQKNFSLIYLEMAFNRAPIADQQETTALLYNQISSLPVAQQDIILHMTTQVLHNFKIPQDKLQRQAQFMFTHSAKDKNIILDYWLDLLLLVIPSAKELQENPSYLAPGLSVNAQKRVKGKIAWTYEALAKVKENVVDFLIAIGDLFASQEIFVHFAIAASDNINSVARKGEDGVRKYFVVKDLEDKQVVDKLFTLFLGTQKTEQVAEDKRSPVSYNVKMKILEYLNRSTVATNNFPSSLQLIFEALFGTESTSRMKQVAISFVQWVLRMADDKYIQTMAPILFSGLLKLLTALKQPEAQEALTSQLRGSIYSAIGALSKKAPQLFANNVQLLEEFFHDTSVEEANVRVYIQEALTHMCAAYLPVIESNPEIKAKVESILLVNAEKGDSQSRYLSVYYTNRLFVYQHVPARYINLLLSNDQRSDVREESHRGLKPYKRNDRDVIADETQKWPDFEELCDYVHEKAVSRRKPDQLPFNEPTYKDILEYLYACLEHSIDSQMTTTEQNEDSKKKFALLREYVDKITAKNNHSIAKLCDLIAEVLGPMPSSELLRVGADTALKMASISPSSVAAVVPNASGVERGNRDGQKSLAQLLSISIAWYYTDDARVKVLNELLTKVKSREGAKKDEVLGAMWAMSYGISRCNQRNIALPQELLTAVMDELWNSVQSSIVTVQLTACQSIGIVGRFKPLPVDGAKKTQIIARIITILNSTEGAQIETAAEALGNIALGDRSAETVKQVLDALLNLFKVKTEEVYFTIGEAITLAAVAWQSTAATDPIASLDDRDQRKSNEFEDEPMSTVVSTLLDKYLFSDRSDTRTAACIWLLSIVKQVGTHPAVTSRLGKIQTAFGRLLADNNEVVQEVASRGLVLLFELGDQNMQQALVGDLVSTLSGGHQGFKVDQGSQIWGVTQEGSGLTTYKELASLATDMNQPDLVYKFLNLASHHALWNSKKGAAFAAKTLATKAESQLKPHLPKLIPKLYRSQYDPNQKIASAMTNILNALVDSKQVGSLYFDDLMKDLLDNMFSSQWRTREATCYAISDLLIGKSADQVLPYLEQLWAKITLVIDDIKETVRKAAEQAFKTLSSITVRLCDPQHTPVKQAQQAVDMALPFLLKKGINSSVADVRQLSMKQIASICKTASFLIKPHLEELVGTMLESIAFNEPQEINYIEQHAESYGISKDMLDEVRRSTARGGPAEMVIAAALEALDAQTGPAALNRAVSTCKTALSTSAKAFSAQFVQKAALQRPEAVKPALPKLLKDLIGLLAAKSNIVRKEVALAVGAVGKLSSEKSLQNSVEDLVDRYQKAEAEDMPTRLGVAEAILALLKNCGYAMQPFYRTIIPIVFFARQDPNEETQKIFTEIWQEAGASLSLYIEPVVEIITKALDSSSWMIKKQGAASITKFANGINYSQMEATQFKALLTSLLTSMRGRLWQGKESLLEALQVFISNYKKNIFELSSTDKSASTPAQIIQVCATECKKRNRDYKKEALNCLASVLNSFDQVIQLYHEYKFDVFDSLKDMLTQIASGEAEQEEDEEEKKSTDKISQAELECRGKAFRCLALAYNRSDDAVTVNTLIDFFVAQHQTQEWPVKSEILVAFKILFGKLTEKNEAVLGQIFTTERRQACLNVIFASFDAKIETIRQNALEAVSAILNLKTSSGTLVYASELQDIISRLQTVTSKNANLATAVDKLLLPFRK